jgi:hypothetical protein
MIDYLLFALGMGWAFLIIEIDYRRTIRKERQK